MSSFLSFPVTPSGCHSGAPQEHQEGEAGYAIMFPNMDGVNIRPFHFCKQTISQTALEEAGPCFLLKKHICLLYPSVIHFAIWKHSWQLIISCLSDTLL